MKGTVKAPSSFIALDKGTANIVELNMGITNAKSLWPRPQTIISQISKQLFIDLMTLPGIQSVILSF